MGCFKTVTGRGTSSIAGFWDGGEFGRSVNGCQLVCCDVGSAVGDLVGYPVGVEDKIKFGVSGFEGTSDGDIVGVNVNRELLWGASEKTRTIDGASLSCFTEVGDVNGDGSIVVRIVVTGICVGSNVGLLVMIVIGPASGEGAGVSTAFAASVEPFTLKTKTGKPSRIRTSFNEDTKFERASGAENRPPESSKCEEVTRNCMRSVSISVAAEPSANAASATGA